MTVPARGLLAVAAALALLVACGDGDDISGPVPGTLVVSLATPHADDGAMLVRLTGPEITNVTAADANLYLYAVGTGPLTVVLVGDLAAGDLLELRVPDVGDVGAYSATVLEVAARSNDLRASLGGYALTVSHRD